jgi:hypothetical protein
MRTLKENIRLWLLVHPRAVALRVSSAGKVSTVTVSSGQSWAQVAASLEAMAPDLIETLDTSGNVGRAVRPADFEDEDEEHQVDASATPATPALDSESARFTLVANLLSQAHAASFDALIQIVNAMAQRAESAERTAALYERQRRQDLEEREDELRDKEDLVKEDPLRQLASTFLGGMANGQSAPTPPTKPTNGKA